MTTIMVRVDGPPLPWELRLQTRRVDQAKPLLKANKRLDSRGKHIESANTNYLNTAAETALEMANLQSHKVSKRTTENRRLANRACAWIRLLLLPRVVSREWI